MKKQLWVLFILLIELFLSPATKAQMFSVEKKERRSYSSNNYVRFGLAPSTFKYKGNEDALALTNPLNFDDLIATFAFESYGFDLRVSFGNSITGMKNQNFFSLEFEFMNNFRIIRNKTVSAGPAFGINTELTTVNKESTQNDFNQTSFGIGFGAFLDLTLTKKIKLQNSVTPGYGFSTSDGGLFGGSLESISTKSRLVFVQLLRNQNISLGYDYTFRSYDLDDDRFDYDLSSHLVTLGISL